MILSFLVISVYYFVFSVFTVDSRMVRYNNIFFKTCQNKLVNNYILKCGAITLIKKNIMLSLLSKFYAHAAFLFTWLFSSSAISRYVLIKYVIFISITVPLTILYATEYEIVVVSIEVAIKSTKNCCTY